MMKILTVKRRVPAALKAGLAMRRMAALRATRAATLAGASARPSAMVRRRGHAVIPFSRFNNFDREPEPPSA